MSTCHFCEPHSRTAGILTLAFHLDFWRWTHEMKGSGSSDEKANFYKRRENMGRQA